MCFHSHHTFRSCSKSSTHLQLDPEQVWAKQGSHWQCTSCMHWRVWFRWFTSRKGKEIKTKHRHEKRVHTPISEHTSPGSRSTLVFNWLKRSLFFWLLYLTFEQVDGLRDLFTCDLTFEQVDGLYECTYAVELQAWHRASDSWHHPPSHDQHATPSVEQHPV